MKRSNDFEFMKDTSAAVAEGIFLPAHIILWVALGFFIFALVWANFAELDEITRGSGKVIPSSDIQKIQNLEGGIVERILVSEGDMVKQGQKLMIIDDTQFSSDLRERGIKILSLQIKIARLEAEAKGRALKFSVRYKGIALQLAKDEYSLFKNRQQTLGLAIELLRNDLKEKEQELEELNRRQEQLEKSYDLLNKELELTYPLAEQGAVSKVELLRLERTANDLKGELEANKLSIPKLNTNIESAKKRIEETTVNFKVAARTELNEAKAELEAIQESNLALADKVDRTTITSPVDGIINQINVNTIGGIIQPGEDVIEIVPLNDKLLIEAEIKPADIGFIRKDLEATIKLTAYDFSIYGGLKGKVKHIGADTILNDKKESVYLIRLETDKNYIEKNGKKLPIISGMRATVDILTGKKTVLDYILKPILKTKQQAFTER